MKQIADDCDVTRAGLLHHFPTKEALLEAVLGRRDELNRARFFQDSWPPGRDGRHFLIRMVRLVLANAAQPGIINLFAVLSAEAIAPNHPAHSYFAHRYERTKGWIREAFLDLRAKGQLLPASTSARSTSISSRSSTDSRCSTSIGPTRSTWPSASAPLSLRSSSNPSPTRRSRRMLLPRRPRWSRSETAVRRVRANDKRPGRPHFCGNPASTVDLVSLCSNNSAASVTPTRIHEILGSIGDSPRELQPRVKRSWNRLSDETRAEVAVRYEAGDTTTQLAKDYGVAKSTIIGILRAKSVVVRRQPLTPGQVSEASRLYESGQSLSQVAKRLDINQETMRTAILKAGVVLRKPVKPKTA